MDREHVLAAYASAWSRTSGEAIRLALQDCWTDSSTYVSPLTDVVRGVEALTSLILDFPVMFPGASMDLTRAPSVHHDAACLAWRMRSTAPIRTLGHNFGHHLDGVDFVQFGDRGQIERITSFFGLSASASPSRRTRAHPGAPAAADSTAPPRQVLGLPDDEVSDLAVGHPAFG